MATIERSVEHQFAVSLDGSLEDDEPGPAAAQAEDSLRSVVAFGTHVDATIDWAVELGAAIPLPGRGRTRERWEALATAARADVAGGRVLEPHLDALAILDEASAEGLVTPADLADMGADAMSSWGVFAAEGDGVRLEARRGDDGTWRLTGVKPWCSLADCVSHALVTAWTGPTERRLFVVAMRAPGVRPQRDGWISRGLAQIRSCPVEFVEAIALPIGDDGWYLRREGFWWGGVGVAACWWGGALPLVDALARAASRPDADQLALTYYGTADARMWAARVALADAASRADRMDPVPVRLISERVRAIVADAVESVLAVADRALGPAPLASDEAHARRVGDLRIYLRQHHAERDLARLGRSLTASAAPPVTTQRTT
jgi:alkylation response protein AidB-like acyl-CoA dehydrogenase